MNSIRTLESAVSSAIAAGEVIERPASVVKELIENALDAEATRIAIHLVDGGKTSIRVEDNGSGIAARDLPLAVENFSTSKIRTIDDLSRVKTLGFRGEALASIRAVASVTIRSRAADEEIGRELRFGSGGAAGDNPFVRSRGTEVIVEQLFFNVPARRKFLRSSAAELRRIVGILQAYALSFPGTAFLLNEGEREILSYPASNIDDRVTMVLGGELSSHLARFEREEGAVCAAGYASQPEFMRSSRSLQFFFVNRRHVRDRLLSNAVNQAYESLIPRDRFPAVVLFLTIPPQDVDVNVHPTKAEVRFRDDTHIHRIVRSAIRDALGGVGGGYADAVQSAYRSFIPDPAASVPGDLFSHGAPKPQPDGTATQVFREVSSSPFRDDETRAALSAGSLYWQLHQSFILIQIRSGLVVIDQHAAHERILFDRARAALSGTRPLVQSLLFPAVITLSPDEFERYETLSGALDALGFDTEPFGPRSIIVHGLPAGTRNWDEGRLLQDILGEGRSGIDALLKSYACRAAVKAGTKLSVEEMESLADQLFATEMPYTCPHGRPTMLRVGLAELERRFARSVSSGNA